MAISPEDAFDPERFAEMVWKWETRIDAFIKENFTGTKERLSYRLDRDGGNWHGTPLPTSVREVIIRRYQKEGWKVKYQPDSTSKYEAIYFNSPRVLHP